MTRTFQLVGTDDNQSTCCCCGRTDLKRVVWLVPIDSDGGPAGEPEHYGTTCAARLLGYAHPTSASTKSRVEREARKAAEDRRAEETARIFRAAVATTVVRGANRFGAPTAEVSVNGEPVTVVGRGPWSAEGTDDEIRVVARRAFAAKTGSLTPRSDDEPGVDDAK
jgi:hypothetical protein